MERADAWDLVTEHTASESLRRHMLNVEACMRWYAASLGEDADAWGLAGLLHDFDYEAHPDEHPLFGLAILEGRGVDPTIYNAIAAHYPDKTGVEPETPMARHLFACDELSGLVTAVALVRPSKDVQDVEVGSVMKKLRTPAFAAGVNREDVARGATLIGLDVETHIGNVLAAMGAMTREPD